AFLAALDAGCQTLARASSPNSVRIFRAFSSSEHTPMGEGKNLIGVDIGSSSIKVCQARETRRGLSVQRIGFAPLPARAIVDGQVRDASLVIEALRRVFADSKIRSKDVALSVSGQSVIIRKISVPLMTPEELEEQISWEAEQHIP